MTSNNFSVKVVPQLGMYTDAGNWALADALWDALRVPAYEFPTEYQLGWFEEWVALHPTHAEVLAGHTEWHDTDVEDRIIWFLEDPARGMKRLIGLMAKEN